MAAEALCRAERSVEDPERDPRQRECVGQAHGFRVHDGEAKEQEAEDGHPEAGDGEAELQEAKQEQRGGGEFDGGVAPCDGLMAMAAAGAQENPAQEGKVVEGADGRAATRAAGARADDRLVARQARDADVEEAAEGEAEDCDEDGDDEGQVLAPVQL